MSGSKSSRRSQAMEFLAHLRAYGACAEGRIGNAGSHLIDVTRFHAMLVDLAGKGIHHRPKLERLSYLFA